MEIEFLFIRMQIIMKKNIALIIGLIILLILSYVCKYLSTESAIFITLLLAILVEKAPTIFSKETKQDVKFYNLLLIIILCFYSFLNFRNAYMKDIYSKNSGILPGKLKAKNVRHVAIDVGS